VEPITERLIVGIATAVLMGGGGLFGLGKVNDAEGVSAELVKFYAPELGRARLEIDRLQRKNEAQKELCVELLDDEKENTAHWRDQCRSRENADS